MISIGGRFVAFIKLLRLINFECRVSSRFLRTNSLFVSFYVYCVFVISLKINKNILCAYVRVFVAYMCYIKTDCTYYSINIFREKGLDPYNLTFHDIHRD